MTLIEMGKRAKNAALSLGVLGTAEKNRALFAMADALTVNAKSILKANEEDLSAARENGMAKHMLDRLALSKARIEGMAAGLRQVAALDDPIGETVEMKRRPNGLVIGKTRVPLGVIAIIYEARPNVTVDAAALTLKSGNAVILRGGREALRSNTALVEILRAAVESVGITPDAVQLVGDPSRETARELMRLNGYVDVLIPRGGAGLIRSVVENATVPVIETGTGNCHVYVDDGADLAMGVDIIYNAKTSRPSVCNAVETLLVAESVAAEFLPLAKKRLDEKEVELRGCERTAAILPGIKLALEEDYYTEYNDYILAVKVVSGLDEAIEHINRYGSGHSEAIVTRDYARAQAFLRRVDAAAVYVNASTRFTDGFEFGLGAEIGISTQKMHARGPMGLRELTSVKYVVYGEGQIRE